MNSMSPAELEELLKPPTEAEAARALARFSEDVRRHYGDRLKGLKPGLIDKTIARHIKEAEGTRAVADYADERVLRAEVHRALRDAEEIIAACEKILHGEGS